MADYGGNILPKHAIYRGPSSAAAVYIGLLILAKFLRGVGLFLAYDLLKLIPVVLFLFVVKAGATIPLVLLQKPFSSGKPITKNQWFRITRHAFVGCILGVLWMFGLSLCGPLRTILLYEHSDIIVIAWGSTLFTNSGASPAKIRGAVCFLVAVITLLLFDHDEKLDHLSDHDSDHRHRNILTHMFYHVINVVGWSDHKGGVVLLFLTLCLNVGYNSAAKKLSVDVGGAKRLHALSSLVQAMILGPWAYIVSSTSDSQVSWISLIFPLTLIILFVFIFDYYIEAVALNHIQPTKTAEYGAYAMFGGALLLALTWNHPYTAKMTSMNKLQEIITEDHVLSAGVVFSLGAFVLATKILLGPVRSGKGSFVGYSMDGMPVYSFTKEALQHTSQSLVMHMKHALKQVLEDTDSRKIFYFLCINLTFTFVEMIYGVWTNSLGLISDGFHMLFDCSALVMGLYAAVMTRWKATRIFSYGFDRVEVLSGFVNGLFLVVIAIFVFSESLHRLAEPPEIDTNRLLAVSVIGLLVNMIGIFAFRGSHGHSHGGHGHSHGGQGHSHGGHGHSHGGQSPSSSHHQSHNTNMEGVFLHVLADTLGSVGVIISSLLIENFGWNIADPICSLFIATMILLSVFPLLKETSCILLLRCPADMEKDISEALSKVLNLEGIVSYRDPHFWYHTSGKVFGTLHIHISHDGVEQKLISQVSAILKDSGLHSVTVQVEKDDYFQHLSGLGANLDQSFTDFPLLSFDKSNSVKAV
ncbi:proton-coupled zinc antiporter SLC30A5-like [Mercenaria mercenaria]|uniref:proton-coupled zinc antiporter SLC30A5-like n=1 Tax=Mercenaria mercenaria TaxID=6596 RepID=UPI00234E4165|nr:proton-coupled zinc antiporter SLC30A5-like [Mercenaria mercenaria]